MTSDVFRQISPEELTREIARLNKVNDVLMNRVERSLENTGNAFALFESNILLQKQVDDRTRQLKTEIVERERIETQLRESRRKLLRHIQHTPLGVIEWDLDVNVVEWNKAAERIFGYCRSEAVGHNAVELISFEEHRDLINEEWKSLVNGDGGTEGIHKNRHKDGSVLLCKWYNTLLVDDNGEIVGVASMVQDVTNAVTNEKQKQKRLERVQRQRDAIRRMIADDGIPAGDVEPAVKRIMEIVANTIDVERVSTWLFNMECTQMECVDLFERSTQRHSQGVKFTMADYPRYFDAVKKERTIAVGDARVDPRTDEFAEGYLIPLGITSMLDTALLVFGKLRGVMCVEHFGEPRAWASDEITFAEEISAQLSQLYSNAERICSEKQRRDLQERLERAERMEALGILAGGVAHDLNNTLGPIVGYTELLLRQLDKDDKVAKRIEKIGKSAQDAADVIQDLLTLARRGRYEMVPTDLNRVVGDYLESPAFLALSESRPDIKVDVDLDESISLLMGSSAHLLKVVMNLVVNAYDAMNDGGALTITTSMRYLEQLSNGYTPENAPGEFLMLSVIDTGKGIAAEDLAKIFEPYYSKKKMGGSSGSGLGLSVVYGIVKDHKGFYDIVSNPGTGTEFQLYFPITTVGIHATDPGKIILEGKESILVVDDSEGQRDVAMEILESLGYNVKTVASGEAAVECLKNNTVDLVLLDMIMDPGIDGLDTYREIIRLHPGQKAVIASGYSATDRVEEMQRLGAGQYIKKPYTMQVLGKAIREELSRPISSRT
ncbi:MAG: response regulator [candidate division Zixibacteria bacterium]|nr:response regulator [candidate division Zixibacteria bacterium]